MSRLMSINILLSELQKELDSERGCAEDLTKKATASTEKANAIKARMKALTAERDALPAEEGTA